MRLRALLPLLALPLLGAGLAPQRAAALVAESRVAASTDDAEENAAGNVSVVGSDLELIWDGNAQTLGLRFSGLAVPRGAEIRSAWVQFESDEARSKSVTLTLQAQAVDDAPAFSTSPRDISTRVRTSQSVAWSPPPWTSVGAAGAQQRTPDLAALVQAVVDRPGWASGNALALLASGGGARRRTARSFDTDPSGAALLHVEYSLVARNDPPALTVISPLHLTQLSDDEAVKLVADARDPEDGELGASVLWTSSRDGVLGRGASLSRTLSVGIHTVTAQVGDAEGLRAQAHVDVQVTAGSHVLLSAGDIASCNSTGDEATAALLDRSFGSLLTLGDNAYPGGTPTDFQSCYEPSWGRHKARTRPVVGNHEYRDGNAAGYYAYFGAVAGAPTQGWYSYDLGGWHVVVLNSNCREIGGCTRSSPQGLWLEADLAAHPRDCTLAAWHHPRFSSGSKHGSSTATRDLYDIAHEHGVDVILTGHDHHYERFAPQNAFGVADASAPRQFVVGSGGASLRPVGDVEPNSVTSAGRVVGVLELTLHDASYDWRFLPAAGHTYTDSGSASCVVTSEPVVTPLGAR